MVKERVKLVPKINYFASEKGNHKFVSTGCSLLDCALGGGYVCGRITNIVGDRSTAKTALATEALINFKRTYPQGSAAYRDTEAAFDQEYAAAMGLDVDNVDFGDDDEPVTTVEGFARDLTTFLREAKKNHPCIYVLDSLDALSDEAEMKRDFGEATYGANKAKMLSEMFRKITSDLGRKDCLLIVISQVRDNIGAMFGEKHKRSGGRALDFYASQIIWLAHLKALKRTINKVERPYGIKVKAKIKKNKVGLPLRECEFDFIFGFGVDDVAAAASWLEEVGRAKDADISNLKEYLKEVDGFTAEKYEHERTELSLVVKKVWAEIETSFLPKRRKY